MSPWIFLFCRSPSESRVSYHMGSFLLAKCISNCYLWKHKANKGSFVSKMGVLDGAQMDGLVVGFYIFFLRNHSTVFGTLPICFTNSLDTYIYLPLWPVFAERSCWILQKSPNFEKNWIRQILPWCQRQLLLNYVHIHAAIWWLKTLNCAL